MDINKLLESERPNEGHRKELLFQEVSDQNGKTSKIPWVY